MFALLRRFVFWSHLVLGVSAGLLIALMSLTGALLGFEHQIVDAIDGVPTTTPAPGATRLSIDTLLARHALASTDLSSVVVRSAPDAAVLLRVRGPQGGTRYLDPYTGGLLPAPKNRLQPRFATLRRLHRVIGVTEGTAGIWTRRLSGSANLAFVLLALSGLYLWFPRRWTRAIVRSSTVPSVALRGKARDFNWHTSFGFWMALPIVGIAGTAVFMSFRWPGRLLDRVAGSVQEQALARAPLKAPVTPVSREVSAPIPLAPLLEQAAALRPDWRMISVSLAGPTDSVTQVLAASGNTFRPDLRSTQLFDPVTGALRVTLSYESLSTSRRIRAWVRYGHTGEALGLVGQSVATFASLIGALLVWTGLAMAWRRWWAWMRRQRLEVPREGTALG